MKTCSWCSTKLRKKLLCKRRRTAAYCSKRCQKGDYQGRKKQCRESYKLHPEGISLRELPGYPVKKE